MTNKIPNDEDRFPALEAEASQFNSPGKPAFAIPSTVDPTGQPPPPPPPNYFMQGAASTLPLWLGIIPFGLAYSLAAKTAGLQPLEIQAMSLLVNAGAAQLIATGLFASAASGFSIVLVTLIVNLRLLLFGTSLLPTIGHLRWYHKALLPINLSDEAYVVSIRKLNDREVGPSFLAGAVVSLYLCWQISTFLGLLLGGFIPDPTALGLQLVFPLSYAVMLMPYVKLRPGQAAALAAGILAITTKLLLGGNWYFLIGAIGGSLAGFWVEKESKA